MEKIIYLTVDNIRHIIQTKNIRSAHDKEWDGCLDGQYMEYYVDGNIPNYIRVAIVDEQVVMFHKDEFDKAIQSLDVYKITYRAVQRKQSGCKDDYLEYYYDLLDGVLESILPESTICTYVNAYDYILERVIDYKIFDGLDKTELPIHEIA